MENKIQQQQHIAILGGFFLSPFKFYRYKFMWILKYLKYKLNVYNNKHN